MYWSRKVSVTAVYSYYYTELSHKSEAGEVDALGPSVRLSVWLAVCVSDSVADVMPLLQLQQNLQRCNTMGRRTRTHAHCQWRLSQWRGLSDGRRMEQPRTGALVNIHRLKSCRVIGCNLQSMYLIMHNSSATVLAVLSFRFYCSCNRGL